MNDPTHDRGSGRMARLSSSIDERRDDSIVRCWDALLQGNLDVAAAESPDSVAIIQQVRAHDDAMRPHDAFLDRLEQELGIRYRATQDVAPITAHSSYPQPYALTPASAPVIEWSNAPSARKARRQVPSNPRWTAMGVAAAVLAILLVAGQLVLYRTDVSQPEPPAIPAAVIAKPTIELIARFEFEPPMWGIPEATEWTYMETSLLSIAPATSFTTDWPWFTAIDGPLTLTVLSGELAITPAGPAFVYPAQRSGQPPVEVQAGKTISIGPNDTIVYSSTDTATGRNEGGETALVLNGVAGTLDKMLPGSAVNPNDVTFIAHEYDMTGATTMPTAGATVSLQRLELAPFDTFVFEPDEDWQYLALIDRAQIDGLRIDDGAIEGLVPNPGAQGIYGGVQLRLDKPGPRTIFNLGDKTVDFYFLVVEPFPDTATPTA